MFSRCICPELRIGGQPSPVGDDVAASCCSRIKRLPTFPGRHSLPCSSPLVHAGACVRGSSIRRRPARSDRQVYNCLHLSLVDLTSVHLESALGWSGASIVFGWSQCSTGASQGEDITGEAAWPRHLHWKPRIASFSSIWVLWTSSAVSCRITPRSK